MISPRIRSNLRNQSYIDLQDHSQQELICYADGYPIPDVRWIRGDELQIPSPLSFND